MPPYPTPMKDVEPLCYGVEAAAAALDVSVRTVWTLISEKQVRTVRIGRRTLIPASDVRALAEGVAA